jgi:glycerol transport system substrate-binding protein
MGIRKEFDEQDMFIDARLEAMGLEDVEVTKSAPSSMAKRKVKMLKSNFRKRSTALLAMTASAVLLVTGCASDGATPTDSDIDAVAAKWVDGEFKLSALTRDEQIAEIKWFHEAAKALGVSDISVVSETIAPHEYESKVLTQAFEEITGIKVTHDLIGEGDVIERIQTEIKTRTSIYDGYVNDSDLIGTHQRGDYIYPVAELMANSAITSPTLDIDDYIGKAFTTGSDGVLYQLPDQQFANLYWFRYDWFSDADIQKQFKDIYGYDLGVPVNWSAYEDIAKFFSTQVNGDGTIDGVKVYGHMDYAKPGPSLQWRFTDAWLSMAGNGDSTQGTPNGLPVDEWGIRVEECHPAGSSVSRGGDLNGPASVYALQKFLDWFEYAPPTAKGMDFSESGPVVGQGEIAQQMFWYTVFTASATDPSLPVMNADGTPKWRMAPSPHGSYWQDGQKLGYQDVGSWTFMKHADENRRAAAWLYAQFVTSKTVDVAKSIAGTTFIRQSTLDHPYFTENAVKYGGLIEFYRSPDRVAWSPTGTNVPDYPTISNLWWQSISKAASGEFTAQEAMNELAAAQDEVMIRLEQSNPDAPCAVKMNPEMDEQYWIDQPGAPVAKLANEKPAGETINYDELVKRWASN